MNIYKSDIVNLQFSLLRYNKNPNDSELNEIFIKIEKMIQNGFISDVCNLINQFGDIKKIASMFYQTDKSSISAEILSNDLIIVETAIEILKIIIKYDYFRNDEKIMYILDKISSKKAAKILEKIDIDNSLAIFAYMNQPKYFEALNDNEAKQITEAFSENEVKSKKITKVLNKNDITVKKINEVLNKHDITAKKIAEVFSENEITAKKIATIFEKHIEDNSHIKATQVFKILKFLNINKTIEILKNMNVKKLIQILENQEYINFIEDIFQKISDSNMATKTSNDTFFIIFFSIATILGFFISCYIFYKSLYTL